MEGLPSILAIKLMLPIRMPAMIATKDGARKCTLVTAGSRAHSTSPKRSPTKRASKQSRAKTPQKTHSVSPLGINMSDVDLHRAVILGLDQAVGGAALARDVQVDGGARCVLFAAARREKRQGRGAGRNKKTAPRRHHSRNAPQPPPASHATSEGLLTRPLVPRHRTQLKGLGSLWLPQRERTFPILCYSPGASGAGRVSGHAVRQAGAPGCAR